MYTRSFNGLRNEKLSYKELLDELTNDTQRYYHDSNGNNLHWPNLITSDDKLLDLFFLE